MVAQRSNWPAFSLAGVSISELCTSIPRLIRYWLPTLPSFEPMRYCRASSRLEIWIGLSGRLSSTIWISLSGPTHLYFGSRSGVRLRENTAKPGVFSASCCRRLQGKRRVSV